MPVNRGHIAALDGLRFCAAMCIIVAHFAPMLQSATTSKLETMLVVNMSTLALFGMPLLFVLSGFVIHFNYHEVVGKHAGGIGAFLLARFARLYPLYLIVFAYCMIKIVSAVGFDGFSSEEIFASTSFLSDLHSHMVVFASGVRLTMIDVYSAVSAAAVSGVLWSVSTEWFFYLTYIFIGKVVVKLSTWEVIGAFVGAGVMLGLHIGLAYYSLNVARWAAGTIAPIAGGASGDSFFIWLTYFSPS